MTNENPNRATETEAIKEVYAALNRNDIPAVLKFFDPQIERIEPEGFKVAGDKIIVPLHVCVRLKDKLEWIEGHIADVFTFRNGKVIEMRTFAEMEQAIAWAGA